VKELNLNNCELDDEDLFRLCEVLRGDSMVESLKLGMNLFSNQEAILELIQIKYQQWHSLDISGF